MVSREGDDKNSEGVVPKVVGEGQRITLLVKLQEGKGEAWDSGMGLDIGPELQD